jgi:large subunit ribosomal protein L19
MNKVQLFEKAYIDGLKREFSLPSVGDLIAVSLNISDDKKTVRIQKLEGICIGVRNKGAGTNFILRRDLDGYISEISIPFYSDLLQDVKVLKKHKVRRAKLYYLLERTGKSARLQEKR